MFLICDAMVVHACILVSFLFFEQLIVSMYLQTLRGFLVLRADTGGD